MLFITQKKSGARKVLKWGGLVLAGVVLVLAVWLGPMLLGYYRFSEHVDATSFAATEAGGAWPRVSDACMPCHGVGGNPVSPVYARLAGQPKAYLVKQLTAFASGERVSPTMAPLALDLRAEEIDRLATFFAAQPVVTTPPALVDAAQVQRGERLAKTGSCIACHGADFHGQEANARLAGQGSLYLARQLRDFKSGARRDPQGAMTSVAATLSDDDIENLAQYLSTLPVRSD